jgi:hypothetical protein
MARPKSIFTGAPNIVDDRGTGWTVLRASVGRASKLGPSFHTDTPSTPVLIFAKKLKIFDSLIFYKF